MPNPTIIEIRWSANPPGQVGPRPQQVPLHTKFKLKSNDPGVLSIEFKNGSPLKDGVMVADALQEHEVVKPGRFKFKCHLLIDGVDKVLDPDDPHVPNGGGEMEIPPDPGAKTI